MSNFTGVAINPATGQPEQAIFMDNYFGPHLYGVRFADGGVYRESAVVDGAVTGHDPRPPRRGPACAMPCSNAESQETMMTLDDRIEAAVLSVEREIGGRLSDQARNEFRVRLRLWSRGLFPELFDGTAWLAPGRGT